VVRRGLCALLKSHAGWEVCAEAADGREAVDKVNQLKPDIVIPASWLREKVAKR
jgi:YesN/AraC family two-component response regulator